MSAKLWLKMGAVYRTFMPGKIQADQVFRGIVTVVGGSWLIQYVTPSEEELFKRYNPDLQRRSLEGRQQRIEDYEKFLGKLKEYSKSDKPMWVAAKEDQERMREEALLRERQQVLAAQARADEIKKLATSRS